MHEPETHFAPAAVADADELDQQIEKVGRNPMITGVMRAVPGLVAVLNEQRQILVVNDALLDELGIEDPATVLGLRPGDAIDCVHAQERPASCGTTRFCETCGVAIAIVVSLGLDEPVERECVVTVRRGDELVDVLLLARSVPIRFDDERLLLLFLRDITLEGNRAALTETFFHDLSNVVFGLSAASDLLDSSCVDDGVATTVRHLVSRLASEVQLQRAVAGGQAGAYDLRLEDVALDDLLEDVAMTVQRRTLGPDRHVVVSRPIPDAVVRTDRVLLTRVLTNMLTNASEASPEGSRVRLWAERDGDVVSFHVWNDGEIPAPVTLRVFQRHFSTKGGVGRGLGTYSMKLLGEELLGGSVDFTTSADGGTEFRLVLPSAAVAVPAG